MPRLCLIICNSNKIYTISDAFSSSILNLIENTIKSLVDSIYIRVFEYLFNSFQLFKKSVATNQKSKSIGFYLHNFDLLIKRKCKYAIYIHTRPEHTKTQWIQPKRFLTKWHRSNHNVHKFCFYRYRSVGRSVARFWICLNIVLFYLASSSIHESPVTQ